VGDELAREKPTHSKTFGCKGALFLCPQGPVIFPVVRKAFIKGLARHFTKEEIAVLNPVASTEPVTAMKRGAFRLARHRFFYETGSGEG